MKRSTRKKLLLVSLGAGVTFSLGIIAVLRYGGHALVHEDPLPSRADVAVVLWGGEDDGEARRDEAFRLLQQRRVDHVLMSVGAVTHFGDWFPDKLHAYLKTKYAGELVSRSTLCEFNVDSTVAESARMLECLEGPGWRSVVLVTSNYHTRRAGLIWKKTLAATGRPFTLTVRGVSDGSFEPKCWYRSRRYAKTWLLEAVKLVWFFFEGIDLRAIESAEP